MKDEDNRMGYIPKEHILYLFKLGGLLRLRFIFVFFFCCYTMWIHFLCK